MKFKSIFSLCLLFPAYSWADTTMCVIDDPYSLVKAISWNSKTGDAAVKTAFEDNYAGKVTGTRVHNMGQKVNISVTYNPTFLDSTSAEFIIFPIEKGHRVIGVDYLFSDGKKLLDKSSVSSDATCHTL